MLIEISEYHLLVGIVLEIGLVHLIVLEGPEWFITQCKEIRHGVQSHERIMCLLFHLETVYLMVERKGSFCGVYSNKIYFVVKYNPTLLTAC